MTTENLNFGRYDARRRRCQEAAPQKKNNMPVSTAKSTTKLLIIFSKRNFVKFNSSRSQGSIEKTKECLYNAVALAIPTDEERFVVITHASCFGVSGLTHSEQEDNRRKLLLLVLLSSQFSSLAQMEQGASNAKTLAPLKTIRKITSYLNLGTFAVGKRSIIKILKQKS